MVSGIHGAEDEFEFEFDWRGNPSRALLSNTDLEGSVEAVTPIKEQEHKIPRSRRKCESVISEVELQRDLFGPGSTLRAIGYRLGSLPANTHVRVPKLQIGKSRHHVKKGRKQAPKNAYRTNNS